MRTIGTWQNSDKTCIKRYQCVVTVLYSRMYTYQCLYHYFIAMRYTRIPYMLSTFKTHLKQYYNNIILITQPHWPSLYCVSITSTISFLILTVQN